MLVSDRKRIAVDSVAGLELAFEVCSPEIVRSKCCRRYYTRMLMGSSETTFLNKSVASE
jgi:hypothetical protein